MFTKIACMIGNHAHSLSDDIDITDFEPVIKAVKSVGSAVCTVCTMIALAFLIINITKLATSAGNENARASALRGILWSFIGFGFFGFGAILLSEFWQMFA